MKRKWLVVSLENGISEDAIEYITYLEHSLLVLTVVMVLCTVHINTAQH